MFEKRHYPYDSMTSFLFENNLYDPKIDKLTDKQILSLMESLGYTPVKTHIAIQTISDWMEGNILEKPMWYYEISLEEPYSTYWWCFSEKKNAMLFKLKWG
jgi:hypothetical protein